tara:strand:- start:193 stop:363 length:171 start_codon:yes stop_codon:yes gene_type:complete
MNIDRTGKLLALANDIMEIASLCRFFEWDVSDKEYVEILTTLEKRAKRILEVQDEG